MPNEASQHPAAGVRVHFELVDGDATAARYEFSLHTTEARFDCAMTLAKDGVTIDRAWSPSEPSAPHLAIALAIAKTVAKSALSEMPVVWPRKVTRWRNK